MYYMCKNLQVKRRFKKTHVGSAHPVISNASKKKSSIDYLTINMFSSIVKEVQNTLFYGTCYPGQMRQTIKNYKFEFNDNLYNEVTKFLTEFRSSRNAEIFLSKFYSSLVLYAHNYISNLNKCLCFISASYRKS